MSKPITVKRKLTALTTAPAATLTTKPNQSTFDQLPDCAYARKPQPVRKPESTASTPALGQLTRIGVAIKQMAEVADGINKIRNAIEGLYKLAGAIWPVLLLLWPN